MRWNKDRFKANEDLQPRTKPVETHYKNTYFLHLPWQKCLQSQIERPFPPSPIAMLFTVTEEMHTWAVKAKTTLHQGWRGGGEFVPFGHDGCTARNWKLHWNASVNTFIRGCRLFCVGSEKSRFQWLHKEQFQHFLEQNIRGRNYCFFDKVLILLGNRSRSESIRGFNWNNYSTIFWALIFSSLQIAWNKSRFPLLSRTLQF